ncbi:hypothetical protein [Sulfuriferula sp.]|uniref:hypothetical protein n=1 Tax=Sulfuriferula sp. TaxID=2025307 RepID=UPI00273223C1|nr:hypothetical protein [Sulfuriferula sp.]MDP2025298.1 hypothetical protein [Sulfuriferula sp.]
MLERYKLSLAAALFGLFLTVSAHAEEVLPWTPITQAEFKMLPPYCAVRLKNDRSTPEWKLWEARLGPGFNDVHHYCGALVHLQRYYGATSQKIKSLFLQEAIHNLDYVIHANVAGFPLLPDVYADKGRTLLLQKKDGEAVQAFLQAIKLNPATVSAYVALSDLSSKEGNKQKALQYAEEGLKNEPDNRALQRRYKVLSGHAFVSPVASDKPAEANAMKAADPGMTGIVAPTTPVSPSTKTDIAPVTTAPASAVDDGQKIGSPTNPYCRFCP